MGESRRTRMTEELLATSLCELLLTKPLERIGVTELCDRADVARTTFYAHHRSVESLLDDVERNFLAHVAYVDELESMTWNQSSLEAYLAYARTNRTRYMALRRAGRIGGRIERESMARYLSSPSGAAAGERERELHLLVVRYTLAGTLSVIDSWLEGDFAGSAGDVARLLMRMSLAAGVL